MDSFTALPERRRDIYAHAVVSILAYHLNVRTFSPSMIWFLIRNLPSLDLTRLRETLRIRHAVAPGKRIR